MLHIWTVRGPIDLRAEIGPGQVQTGTARMGKDEAEDLLERAEDLEEQGRFSE